MEDNEKFNELKMESTDYKPLVSIITPVYNTEKYLTDCVKSVLAQTFKDWELILINDCSIDNSQKIMDDFAELDFRIISLENQENVGSGETRNRGISLAKGRFLCFLDSDDRWKPEKLLSQLDFLNSTGHAFTFSSYDFIDSLGNSIKAPKVVTSQPIDYEFLLKRTEIFTSTVMIDLEQTGKIFMPLHRRKQDYGLWLSLLKSGHQAFGMKEVLAEYRLREGSATSKKWTLVWKHVVFLKQTQGFGWGRSLIYTGHWAYNGFIKYYLQ